MRNAILCLALLAVGTSHGQWLEQTFFLPGEYGGLVWPDCIAVDTVHDKVYFSMGDEPFMSRDGQDSTTFWVVVVDAVTLERVAHIPVPFLAGCLGFNPANGKLYCSFRGTVGVIDCATDSLVALIPVGNHEDDSLCVNPDDNRVYCAHHQEVTVIDGGADTILTRLPVPGYPLLLTYAGVNNTVYCGDAKGKLTLIDGRRDTIRAVLDLSPGESEVSGACWNPTESKYYCLLYDDLLVVDGFGDSLLTQMEVGGAAALCCNPTANEVYCLVYPESVFVLDCSADTVKAKFRYPRHWSEAAHGCVSSPASNRLYGIAWCGGYNRDVMVADCAAARFLAYLPTGYAPRGLGYDPERDRLYITNAKDDDATVIDCAGDSVLCTVGLGFRVWGMTCATNENKVYCSGTSSEVLAIDASTNRVVAEIPAGSYVYEMCYNPVLSKLYCTRSNTDSIMVIDCVTDSIVGWVALGDTAYYLAFSPVGGSKVYCSGYPTSVIDCVRDSVIAKVQCGGPLLVNTREDKLYATADAWPYHLAAIDCHGDTVLHVSDVGGRPLVYNPVGNRLYVGKYEGGGVARLHIVDGHTDSAVVTLDSIQMDAWYDGCYNSLRNKVYVSGDPYTRHGILLVFDGSTDSLLGLHYDPAGDGWGIGSLIYDSPSDKVYFFGGRGFGVLDGATDSLVAKFTLGDDGPSALAWAPAVRRLYAAEDHASRVSVFRDSLVPGIEEGRDTPSALRQTPEATIAKGVLRLEHSKQNTENRAELMDAAGRVVMRLARGENDVRRLSPGVYFVRETAASGGRSSVERVVVVR